MTFKLLEPVQALKIIRHINAQDYAEMDADFQVLLRVPFPIRKILKCPVDYQFWGVLVDVLDYKASAQEIKKGGRGDGQKQSPRHSHHRRTESRQAKRR